MNGLIRFSLGNPRAITVLMLTGLIGGAVSLALIPADILPVYKSPGVQVLTFYNGMAASSVEADITGRMERWVGQAAGTRRQESRSIIGASIIRNYYSDDTDPSAALTQVNSLATAAIPNLPPGPLPPVILPSDPTPATPVCPSLAARPRTNPPSTTRARQVLAIMASQGAPVVYGGRLRTILPCSTSWHRPAAVDNRMDALDQYNIFLPAGDASSAGPTTLDSNDVRWWADGDIDQGRTGRKMVFLRDVACRGHQPHQTNIVGWAGQQCTSVYRRQGQYPEWWTPRTGPGMKDRLTTPDVDLAGHGPVDLRPQGDRAWPRRASGRPVLAGDPAVFGWWRLTLIAVTGIGRGAGGAACLYGVGQSVNVMTLAGWPGGRSLVDLAIVVLENTTATSGWAAEGGRVPRATRWPCPP